MSHSAESCKASCPVQWLEAKCSDDTGKCESLTPYKILQGLLLSSGVCYVTGFCFGLGVNLQIIEGTA